MTTRTKRLAVRGQRTRNRLASLIARVGFGDEYFLVIVSIFIGALTGVFAHLFYNLIEAAHGFAYGHGDTAGLYHGRIWMLILLPAAGGLAVGIITVAFAKEAKGHGVPEVMDAMSRKSGIIRGRVAAAKAVASALTIGTGGSAGTEGPIVQIGAAIGSRIGQFLHIHPRQMGIVVACGVSAGISAIFNAPIAGVMFALEIFLRDFTFKTFSPIVFSSVISCSIMHALRAEDTAIFEVNTLRKVGYLFSGHELPFFLILGVLSAIAAVIFIRALYLTEDFSDWLRVPDAIKPAIGAALLGTCGAIYVTVSHNDAVPKFFGNGYPAINFLLEPSVLTSSVGWLLLLFVLKAMATCFTLGSGGSGGVFAPSLMLGATLGAAFGMTLTWLGWIDSSAVSAYALVGMAALVAGTTHAPLTAIVMLYEITREPKVVLPVMFAAIVATAGAQLMLRDSIYTLKLRRRGVRVGSVTDLTILRRVTVSDVRRIDAEFVHPADPLQSLLDLAGKTEATDFVVVDDNDALLGMVTGRDIRTALLQPEAVSLLIVQELMRTGLSPVTPDETLDVVLDKFARSDVESLPVVGDLETGPVMGLITRRAVMHSYQQELDRQSQ